jgi:hypothetical protein
MVTRSRQNPQSFNTAALCVVNLPESLKQAPSNRAEGAQGCSRG